MMKEPRRHSLFGEGDDFKYVLQAEPTKDLAFRKQKSSPRNVSSQNVR